MDALPCPLCGYDAPARECPHCRLAPQQAELQAPLRGRLAGVSTGFAAVPKGLSILARTPRVKRFLIPPLFLTLVAFALFFYWLWGAFGALVEAARQQDVSGLDIQWEWVRTAVEWLIRTNVLVWLAGVGQLLLFVVTSYLVAAWTFAIVYEAISGPFLDEIQGRLEARWFGINPRDALERPTDLPVRKCVVYSTAAGIPAGVLLIFFWFATGPPAWGALAAAPLPFIIAGLASRDYGRWLRWVIAIEGRTLWVSVKAALLSGFVLLCFLWLKLIPFVGPVLFFALAGFTTAISLLDIPFSRRQWSLGRRLLFMGQNALPMVAFGAMAAVVFMIPIVGAVVMVPAASIGGLWLVCRLDKNPLRPATLRFDAPPETAPAREAV